MVTGFDRKALDISDFAAVESVITPSKPAVVINAAAYNQVDAAENDATAAFEANALGVRNLALACRQTGARLVHYSTDYVFDGEKRSLYIETDTPHPLGAYAVSKLAGEHFAQAYLDNPLILRVSGVFGPGGMFTPRGNFPELMLRLAGEGKPLRVISDSFASPTYAPAIAERTADLVEQGIGGLFHLGGGEAISWYDYAGLIFEEAGLKPSSFTATSQSEFKTAARRPKFSALSNEKLEAAGMKSMPTLRQAVAEYLKVRQVTKAHRAG